LPRGGFGLLRWIEPHPVLPRLPRTSSGCRLVEISQSLALTSIFALGDMPLQAVATRAYLAVGIGSGLASDIVAV
jgi:hypothetical protein